MSSGGKFKKSDHGQDILDSDGNVTARICIDCHEAKPLDQYQIQVGGKKARDCKVCRRAKFVRGMEAAKQDGVEVDKAWVIKEAKKLYLETNKYNDKIKLLDTISRNLGEKNPGLTDDAKLVRDLIASKKKAQEIKGR